MANSQNSNSIRPSGVSFLGVPGVPGVPRHPQILADQLTGSTFLDRPSSMVSCCGSLAKYDLLLDLPMVKLLLLRPYNHDILNQVHIFQLNQYCFGHQKPLFQMPRMWTTVSKQTHMKRHKIMTQLANKGIRISHQSENQKYLLR